jgi:hypothetical protein
LLAQTRGQAKNRWPCHCCSYQSPGTQIPLQIRPGRSRVSRHTSGPILKPEVFLVLFTDACP